MLLKGDLARFFELLHGPYPLYFLLTAQLRVALTTRVLIHVGEPIEGLHLLLQSVYSTSHEVFELGS